MSVNQYGITEGVQGSVSDKDSELLKSLERQQRQRDKDIFEQHIMKEYDREMTTNQAKAMAQQLEDAGFMGMQGKHLATVSTPYDGTQIATILKVRTSMLQSTTPPGGWSNASADQKFSRQHLFQISKQTTLNPSRGPIDTSYQTSSMSQQHNLGSIKQALYDGIYGDSMDPDKMKQRSTYELVDKEGSSDLASQYISNMIRGTASDKRIRQDIAMKIL